MDRTRQTTPGWAPGAIQLITHPGLNWRAAPAALPRELGQQQPLPQPTIRWGEAIGQAGGCPAHRGGVARAGLRDCRTGQAGSVRFGCGRGRGPPHGQGPPVGPGRQAGAGPAQRHCLQGRLRLFWRGRPRGLPRGGLRRGAQAWDGFAADSRAGRRLMVFYCAVGVVTPSCAANTGPTALACNHQRRRASLGTTARACPVMQMHIQIAFNNPNTFLIPLICGCRQWQGSL